jgi:hypothetical protein
VTPRPGDVWVSRTDGRITVDSVAEDGRVIFLMGYVEGRPVTRISTVEAMRDDQMQWRPLSSGGRP